LRAVADRDLRNLEYHAIKVQERASTEADFEAIVAMEWRPDRGAVSDSGEAFHHFSF
jgi:hypothetical protein